MARLTLTQTEDRIQTVLSDGKPHTFAELLACLPDPEYATLRTLRVHISNIRRKLPDGQMIHRVARNGRPYYIHVRALTSVD